MKTKVQISFVLRSRRSVESPRKSQIEGTDHLSTAINKTRGTDQEILRKAKYRSKFQVDLYLALSSKA